MKKTALVITVLLSTTIALAQKSFTELVNHKKLDKMINLNYPAGKPSADGSGITPDLAKRPVKTVALVSFFVKDIGDEDGYKYIGLSESGGNALATVFYNESINQVKSAFSNNGIELKTIMETLDSDDKKAAYESFELRVTKSMKLISGFVNNLENYATSAGLPISATPSDYKLISSTMAPADYYVAESMGELAISLGVDAVMVGFVDTKTTSKNTTFMKTGLAINGPNPTEKIAGKKYPSRSYNTGMHYGSVEIEAEKPFIFVERKKQEILGDDFDGYGDLMEKLAQSLSSQLAAKSAGS